MLQRSLFFLAFYLIGLLVMAQNTFERGYIVKTEGDTLQGEISYNWSTTEAKLNFRVGSLKKSYDKTAISAFKIANGDLYLNRTVALDVSPTLLEKMLYVGKDTFETRTLFLKVLLLGSANLYQYYDSERQRFHYFIESAESNGTIELVENKRKIDLSEIDEVKNVAGLVKTQDKYKGQLAYLMKDCPAVISTIEEMETLSEKAILAVFEQYHACSGAPLQYVQGSHLRGSRVHLGLLAGAQLFDITPEGVFFPVNLDTSPHLTPNVGLEAMFQFSHRRTFTIHLLTYYSQFKASETFFEDRAVLDGFSTINYAWQQWTSQVKANFNLGIGDQFFFLHTGLGVNLIFDATGTKDLDTGSRTNLANKNHDRQLLITFGGGYQFGKIRGSIDYDLGGSATHLRFGQSRAVSLRLTYFFLP